MTTGLEWIIDASECSPSALADASLLRALCDEVIGSLELHVVGEPLWHHFPGPGGLTGLYLLSESHLACHTWPETGTATFNLFCCRPRPEFAWSERISELLAAGAVTVRRVERGRSAPLNREDVRRAESTPRSLQRGAT